MPTSADLLATSELSCDSRLVRLGDEAAAAGCATNARSDRNSAMNRISALPACSRADARIIAKRPHSFQIVKISHFGTEYVDDYVVGVDQYPVGRRKPFDPDVPSKSLLDLVGKLNRHRRDLPGRAPGGDHHVVGDVRFAGQAEWTRPPGPGRRRATEERACEGLQRRWDAPVGGAQRDVRSRGLLANSGTPNAERAACELRSAIPVGILRANSGCGGRIGRQAKENDRRCTPFRPVLGLARRMDEPSQPTHRARRVGSRIITGPANHRNRHFAG